MKHLFSLILICALVLSGCAPAGTGSSSSASAGSSSEGELITFTDDLGRTVSLAQPQRVACLIGSFADLWCLAGGKDALVAAADDTWTSFDLGLGEDVANLGAVKEPNVEPLLQSKPDLVIASSNTDAQVALLDTLEGMGLTVAYFKVSSFQDYLNMLDICTQLTGRTDCYEQYGQALQDQVDAAKAKCAGLSPTVLYVRATGSSCKVKNSQDTVLGEMLADLGCVNIADSSESLLEQLSLEVILDQDPDFIFAILQGSDPTDAQRTLDETLLSNPAWQSLTAVKEGRFFVLDDQLYNLKPNARWGDAYEQLADLLCANAPA